MSDHMNPSTEPRYFNFKSLRTRFLISSRYWTRDANVPANVGRSVARSIKVSATEVGPGVMSRCRAATKDGSVYNLFARTVIPAGGAFPESGVSFAPVTWIHWGRVFEPAGALQICHCTSRIVTIALA